MTTRITVDPITRIEGHLRIDVEVDDGKVSKAWSSGQMWRGIEKILVGRDPREAWTYTQRFCGVCTTVHAITSVRAVENALDLEVPVNAQLVRNIIQTAHAIQDHIVHFYHLSAVDWVDVVSALDADPVATAKLAESLSDWHLNGPHEMKAVQERLKTFVGSGQLGPFASGYWGHPAMKLPPEVNLLAVAHYLQALDIQNNANKIVAILGGKSPHIQNVAVGGVSNSIGHDAPSVLNIERLMLIKGFIDKLDHFVKSTYLVDVPAVGAFYLDWAGIGGGVNNYLTVPDCPQDTKGTVFDLPGGYIENGDINSLKPITTFGDAYFRDGVAESSKHAWYQGGDALHPWVGETEPEYTDFQDDGKYSWVKAPTFYGKRAEVGPLADVLVGVASGHEGYNQYLNQALDILKTVSQNPDIPLSAVNSTIGRHAARAVRCAVMMDTLKSQWQKLVDNVGTGDLDTFNAPVFPKGEIKGVGFHQAPRGTLSHWVVIEDGKIKNYQAVVPSTWNAGPRDADGEIGPYESSLMDNPVADPEKPLEVLRTVHSFDPCIACAIHMVDTEQQEIVRVKAL
ncbi:MAG: nickel-dependent hydrogenase large subunit [Candidatus Thiodiazotropha sp. (ex Lucina aurantia)]|uniref:hydrogenase (acceptor) n=1 Tax=Candidatus Thiodiazotropha endolucinida TaxID=1655433 RepID=A0A7Z1AG51_9GAMM|nr:nickel-dependent hydrogenase large subunit [Candidatus Thiodiazotropha endolucinida]MBT3012141.1 nickel-dependent hydrogenase large subunit [Candidatus Thiodiazotropha sp. (ex Lucina pensylvanica)]MBT3014875.1 nickel-dependent hydrogenase large subunit [Candidatus Thiodiazotropha taylori]MBT3039159.1 nickel-dependent hydrogenase large subunit [Candidatus Thiodiazotropha sp. (ex Codakia orbicularis)]MBV2101864.1 nickel-dependent hydrogenase large subunit [Candidatus Thiodiazotropha sp. (ex Lu